MNLENNDRLLVGRFKDRSIKHFKDFLRENLYSPEEIDKLNQFLNNSGMYPVEQKAYIHRTNKVFTLAYNNVRVGVLYASSQRIDFKLGLGSKKISAPEFYKEILNSLFEDSEITNALLNLKTAESEKYLREPIQFSYKVAISQKYSDELSQIPKILYDVKIDINKFENISDYKKILDVSR